MQVIGLQTLKIQLLYTIYNFDYVISIFIEFFKKKYNEIAILHESYNDEKEKLIKDMQTQDYLKLLIDYRNI